jgi:hypothetical protein
MPIVQPAMSVGLAPIVAVAWLHWSCDFDTPGDALHTSGSSRAPPLELLV